MNTKWLAEDDRRLVALIKLLKLLKAAREMLKVLDTDTDEVPHGRS